MLLISAKVGPIKSISEPQTVHIDSKVTVLVGMNEAGKTVFLQALENALDAKGRAGFDPVEDYPRKDLPNYLRSHKDTPQDVVTLTYRLEDDEIHQLNSSFGTQLPNGFSFSTVHNYANGSRVSLSVDEKPVLQMLAKTGELSSDAKVAISAAASVRDIPNALARVSLTTEDEAFLSRLNERIGKSQWKSVLGFEVWTWIDGRRPKFLYFGDYELLPSKMNLNDLADRVTRSSSDPKALGPEHLGILALLRMADIGVRDFATPGGYESLKAKIEGVSISLTDQIMAFWKQNEDLEVEIDIKPDSEDVPPFNSGPNLYLRIKNRRHRGVSTPFGQRSRGFIWFFSFLVWFDSIQSQLSIAGDRGHRSLILLLDEPGLSLHALAQLDFLRYIDELADRHQVLYTTHSPFMVHMDKLSQVRLVEDRVKTGTYITADVTDSERRTTFPLQAALGWTIAQSLFISERNLLVEGPSDLIYLKAISSHLETIGRTGLRDDITIVPAGGLDKVATFVALLGANDLKLAVLYDFSGSPDQRLLDLARQKMISPKAVLNASQFRDLGSIGVDGPPTDLEDLLPVDVYLNYFNRTFASKLKGVSFVPLDLPLGDRIIERIGRLLASRGMELRPSGGFNHYSVASTFASSPPMTLEPATLNRFEALFKTINGLL